MAIAMVILFITAGAMAVGVMVEGILVVVITDNPSLSPLSLRRD
jgi:hypothetical protein